VRPSGVTVRQVLARFKWGKKFDWESPGTADPEDWHSLCVESPTGRLGINASRPAPAAHMRTCTPPLLLKWRAWSTGSMARNTLIRRPFPLIGRHCQLDPELE
jgi:hypothetical protein